MKYILAFGILLGACATVHGATQDPKIYLVKWHVAQVVPALCDNSHPVDPWTDTPHTGVKIEPPIDCYESIGKDMQRSFATREEAERFIQTKPTDEYQKLFRAVVSDVQIEEAHQ